MPSPDNPTAAQIEIGIGNALKTRDMVAVADMLSALAAVDLDRAAIVYKALQIGLDLAEVLGWDRS